MIVKRHDHLQALQAARLILLFRNPLHLEHLEHLVPNVSQAVDCAAESIGEAALIQFGSFAQPRRAYLH